MYKLLSILTITATLLSCSNKTIENKNAKLKGVVEGLSNRTLILESKSEIDSIKIDSLGNFNFTKNLSSPTYFTLKYGRKSIYIYLTNNSDLSLKTNKDNFNKNLIFTGNGSKENNLLAAKTKLESDLNYFPTVFKLFPNSYLSKIDSVTTLFYNLSKQYSSSGKVDTTFLNTFNTEIKYSKLSDNLFYTPYHNYFANEKLELPEKIKLEIDEAIVDNDNYIDSPSYIEFINNASRKKYKKSFGVDDEDTDMPDYLNWIDNEYTSQKVKNEIYYNAIKYHISYVNEAQRDSIYSTFSRLNTDPIYKQKIDKVYASFEKLRKGKPAPKWSYPDINGKEYALDDFKGKYVYIDVWATWCGPCKAEIPELAKLVEEYKKKDIVFVSVSVDNSKNAWESMLKKEKFDWIQIHADKDWKSDIVIQNEIKGIPRFMMIDREGNIVDVNAPQPSSDKIRPLINELLSK